ncbi:MAG TPA: RDD family protein [Streptosporangiaceae bacterium]|nr:RDD family protein [Streptosporangiaceae bacterium]
MTSMPGQDAPQPWAGGTQQDAGDRTGAYSPQGAPGQEFGGLPPGGRPQGGYPGDAYGSHWAGRSGWEGPVNRDETNVVGRRVVQYIIDYVLVGIIPAIAYWVFNRGSGFLHGFGWTIATLIALVVYLWYWVLRPNGHQGQTFGMQLLGLRVISKDGGPASMLQLFVRGVLLIVDTLIFGLVGLITMMASRYHQRVGDHMARTLVVGASHSGDTFGHDQSDQSAGYRVEDERLARPDTYSGDAYGQHLGTPEAGGTNQGTSG